jgi:signal transduction histidine kinase
MFNMTLSNSIQTKVFVIFGGFTLLLSVIYWSMSILIGYIVEDEILEKVLRLEADYIQQSYRENPSRIVAPRVDYVTLYLSQERAPLAIKQALSDYPNETEVFVSKTEHYHIQHLYLAEKYHSLLVAEVSPLLTVTNVSRGLIVLFFGIFIVTLALALWLAYRLALRTTRPITLLAREVEQQHINPTLPSNSKQPSFDLSGTEQKDEIGFLATTLQNTLGELNDSIKRESDFNRDISHELRTPLTVLNNTLSLAKQRPLSASDLQQLNDSTDTMNQLVTTLLALARAETINKEPVNLCGALEQCVIDLQHKMTEPLFDVNLEIDQHFSVVTNQQLLTLLINNLIENAIAHASSNHLTIRLDLADRQSPRLIFENSIDQPLSDDITNPQVKSEASQGFGQGLYLVNRVIEALHWSFTITDESDCFQFVIDLKPKDLKN